MNDRYLYRAKRTDNGEWVEGGLITGVFCRLGQDIPYILCPDKADYDCFEDFSEENGIFEVDPSTICQCTALKDKHGKLIWENDIVSGKMYLDHGQWGESVDDKRIVEWDDAYARFIPCSYMKLDKYEVIGNIFDNPNCWRWENDRSGEI